jgi:hypothetical protein
MELKHVKTFEQYSSNDTEKINEGLFTSLKTDIDKFLKEPTDEKKANKLMTTMFAQSFNAKATKHLKDEVIGLSLEEKVSLLKQASKKLENPKIGILKPIKKKDGVIVVGGQSIESKGGLMGAAGE